MTVDTYAYLAPHCLVAFELIVKEGVASNIDITYGVARHTSTTYNYIIRPYTRFVKL